jgi:N6-L-threonylcarbamoyladenine synthase
VVPELASREHLRNMVPVVQEALSQAGLTLEEMDGIAVTIGPGLIGSLLVGLYYAKALASVHRKPLAAVNHLEGHILSIFLEEQVPPFPFVALTVSGGHTTLYHVKGFGDYEKLGQTLDDAAGEAFDKVAKILGLGYPGGPVIEKVSGAGDKESIPFPRALLSPGSLDFSFSGLKTSVALYVKKWQENGGETAGIRMEDITASFQEAVIDVLVRKTIKAVERTGVDSVVIAGGVACNNPLRERFRENFAERSKSFYYPRPAYCTDNGAMIALAGYHRIKNGQEADMAVDVRSRYSIEELSPLA